jgi:hypothetical protein
MSNCHIPTSYRSPPLNAVHKQLRQVVLRAIDNLPPRQIERALVAVVAEFVCNEAGAMAPHVAQRVVDELNQIMSEAAEREYA